MPVQGQRVRVGGSGFTVFHWGSQVIGFAQEVRVAGVTPVAQPVVIQPLNAAQPLEIITPGAHANGVLTMVLTELYNEPVWNRLAGLANSQDIIDIMRTVAANNQGVRITKWVQPPTGLSNRGPYAETYYDCVVARVGDDENINIATMEVNKEVEVWYTYSKKFHVNGGARVHPLIY